MRRPLAFAAIAVVALAAAGCDEEGVVQVHSLTFRGVHAVQASAIKAVLATHVNSRLPWGRKAYFDRARFDADLKRIQTFYIDRGYPDARVKGFDVELNKKEDAVDITLTIDEGAPVKIIAVDFVNFEVLPAADSNRLRKSMPLVIGRPRDRQLVLATHELALNALRDRGYPYAVVVYGEDDGSDGKSARLTFTATPGRLAQFGPVEIAGNTHVSDRVIRRSLRYEEGETYRRSLVQESQRRLYSTQLFQFVTVVPTPPGTKSSEADVEAAAEKENSDRVPQVPDATPPADQPAAVPTRITVAEGKPERTIFGVGYGTEEKARVDAQYRRLNFLGAGRTAEAHVRWSSLDRGVRLSLNQPELVAHLSLAVMGQQWYTYTPAYRSVTTGAKATWTYRVGPRSYWDVSFTSERDASTIESSVLGNARLRNGLIALGLNPESDEQRGTLNAIGADFQWSTTNNALNANRGYQLTLHAEQAGRFLPGSFSYFSTTGDARHYLPLGDRLLWANRLQVGAIVPAETDADVPFGRRYFLGGSTSLRGWGIYEVGPLSGGFPVGGNSMLAFTSEMRAQVQGNLGLVLFLDAGNVWADARGIQFRDLRYAVGPGLRYQTPIGPLRFDVGYQLNPEPDLLVNGEPQHRRWRVHFSVGQAF